MMDFPYDLIYPNETVPGLLLLAGILRICDL